MKFRLQDLRDHILDEYNKAVDQDEFISSLRSLLHGLSRYAGQSVDLIQWIPIERIQANDYNPNQVASGELKLLYASIKADRFTQPVVTVYDKDRDRYVIIDGFHRYFTMKTNKDISDMTG